jgi:hypothetical protein
LDEAGGNDDQRGQDEDRRPLDIADLGVADPDAIDTRIEGISESAERALLPMPVETLNNR